MTDSVVSRATALFTARDESSGVVRKSEQELQKYAAAVAAVNARHDEATKKAKASAAAQRETLRRRREELSAARAQVTADRQNSRITVDEAKKRKAAIADELAALKSKEQEVTRQERQRVGRIERVRKGARATVEATNRERQALQDKIELERRAFATWSEQSKKRISRENELRRAINQRVSAEVEGLRRMGGRQRGEGLISRPGGRVTNMETIAAVSAGTAVLLGGSRAREMQTAHTAAPGAGVFAAGREGRNVGGGRFDTSNSWKSGLGAAVAGSAIFSAAAPVLGGILVGRAIRSGVRAIGEYENAVVDLQKVLRGTAEEQEAIVDSVTALADVMPNAREELLKMGAAGAQMGVAGKQVAVFTSAMQKLISAAPSITEQEALQFGQTKAFLGSGVGYQELAGIITEIGNTQPATESRILELIHQVGGGLGTLRGQAGFSSADVAGIGGYLASVGARPESARTTIREWTQELLEALAGAEDKMEAFSKVTGKTEEQLREMTSVEILGSFLEGMNRLGVSSKGLLDTINLDGDRALAVLAAMGLRVEDFYASVKSANEQVARGGVAVDKEFQARAATMTARFQIVNNWWKEWTESSGQGARALAATYETVTQALIGPRGANRKSWMRDEVEKIHDELEAIQRMRNVFAFFGLADDGPSDHVRGLHRRKNDLLEDLGVFSGGGNPLEAYGVSPELRKQLQDEIELGLSVQQRNIFGKTGLAHPDGPEPLPEWVKAAVEIMAEFEKARQAAVLSRLAQKKTEQADAADAAQVAAVAAAAARSRDYWAGNAAEQERFFLDEDNAEYRLRSGRLAARLPGGASDADLYGRPQLGGTGTLRLGSSYGDRGRSAFFNAYQRVASPEYQQEQADLAERQRAYNEELQAGGKFADGFADALGDMGVAAMFTADNGRQAFEGFADAIRGTMQTAVSDGKLSLDSLKSYFLSFALDVSTRSLFQYAIGPALGAVLPGLGASPTQYSLKAAGGSVSPGFVRVGEQGPEMLRLNAPGHVYSAAETRMMEGGRGGGEGITVNFNGPMSNNDEYGRRVVTTAVERAVVAVRQIEAAEFRRGGEV